MLVAMKNTLRQRLGNRKWWLSQLKTVLLVVAIVSAVGFYQQRNMVSGYAPDLVTTTLTGDLYKLSDHYRQGPVLVYFWGSWCPICDQTSPAVSDIAAASSGGGSRVISVALASGSDQTVMDYLHRHQYVFTTLNDDSGAISQRWGVTVTPSFFYLNTKGEIVMVSAGLSSEWGIRIRLWLARYL